jgi:hypothetical protein
MRNFVTRFFSNAPFKSNSPRRTIAVAGCFVLLGGYASFQVAAYPTGVTGTTQKSGGGGCSCHSSGANSGTSVTISTSATTFYTGQSYTFTVSVANSSKAAAGVNVAVGNGTLTAGNGLQKVGNELTHSAKVVGLPASWTFTYTAPSSAGTDNIYATGNAVNNNGSADGGDLWNHATTFSVNVVAPPTKLIALSKTTMNLGNVRVGSNKSDTMRIFSYGDEDLTISSSTMKFGTHFSTSPTGSNRTINTGSNEVNTITFAPTAKGSFVDTLIINNNSTVAGDTRKTVIVTGTGIQGSFSGGNSLAFGDVDVNSSKRLGYVFSNNGDDTLFINNATISGNGYSIVSQPTDLSLAPNQKDSVVIELATTAKQTYSGTLTITAQGGVTVPSVSLAGNGVAAGIAAQTTNLGGIRVGLVNQGTVTVTNNGNDTLRITNAQFTAGATNRFAVTGFSAVSVLPGQSTPISVSYTPNDLIADTATLTLTSNALGQPTFNISVFGTGTIPTMALTDGQDTVRFAAVRTGKTQSLTFNVRNTGTDILNITKVTVGTPFSVEAKPSSIEPKTQQAVTIKFAPTATGTFTGMVVVTGDDPNNTSDTVYVLGTGVNSALNVPSNLEFGSTAPNVEVVQNLVLTNEGSAAVTINGYKLTGSGATAYRLIDTAAHTIAANGTATLKVGFKPLSTGVFGATLNIAVDDNTAPVRSVALAGVGVQGQLQVLPTTLDFGTVDSGTVSAEKLITLKNTGTAAITITSVNFECLPKFVPNGAPVTSIAAGDSAKIGVTYHPGARGQDACTASITTSEGNTISIIISGTSKGKDVQGSVKSNSPIADFKLKINPNPVSGTTMISLSMKRGADVQFDVYDMQGRVVTQIAGRYLPFGEHSISLSMLGIANGEYMIIASSDGVIAGDAKIIVQR